MITPSSPITPGSEDSTEADPSDGVHYGTSGDDRRLLPSLTPSEWIIFGALAALLAAANIYTTLLIGWGDSEARWTGGGTPYRKPWPHSTKRQPWPM